MKSVKSNLRQQILKENNFSVTDYVSQLVINNVNANIYAKYIFELRAHIYHTLAGQIKEDMR